MDNTEIHYLTYDPEEIFQEMNLAYIQAKRKCCCAACRP